MRKIAAVLGLLLLLGCEEDTIHPINSTIQIEPTEITVGTEKRIFLSCATEQTYICSNFNILTTQQVQQNLFRINFSGIDKISYCANTLGPAQAKVDLGALPNGDYLLELNSKTFRNNGTLKVTATEIKLDFPHQDGIAIIKEVFKR
ncbi:hypothetical protein AAE02nite_00190 [Adhaeribacter aerolatus]|uniref:Lipoprotein n=1 Tax=Adhaeribacter aerolatus TaxID=670289 RepID=A0A512ARK9_9BACT|nr:hypothetical protein [Adhaeribacter aerolatus]GEO02355.1 hypothetical protein AAE02nite_00190 [Adhaeribacter aerolatus]